MEVNQKVWVSNNYGKLEGIITDKTNNYFYVDILVGGIKQYNIVLEKNSNRITIRE